MPVFGQCADDQVYRSLCNGWAADCPPSGHGVPTRMSRADDTRKEAG